MKHFSICALISAYSSSGYRNPSIKINLPRLTQQMSLNSVVVFTTTGSIRIRIRVRRLAMAELKCGIDSGLPVDILDKSKNN